LPSPVDEFQSKQTTACVWVSFTRLDLANLARGFPRTEVQHLLDALKVYNPALARESTVECPPRVISRSSPARADNPTSCGMYCNGPSARRSDRRQATRNGGDGADRHEAKLAVQVGRWPSRRSLSTSAHISSLSVSKLSWSGSEVVVVGLGAGLRHYGNTRGALSRCPVREAHT
jgi:hypothetical protein